MKIIVTGGSGFIGTNLIRDLLEKGFDVKNFDLNESKQFPQLTTIGDVCDPNEVMRACEGMNAIIHLAAEHRDNIHPTDLYYKVNVDGAKRITEAATANDIHTIIFTSTVALYGLNIGIPEETSPVHPFNDYGRSKLQAENAFRQWVEQDASRSLVIVRPSVVFGENNRGNVYNLLKQIYGGKFFIIGQGNNKKSMAYVKNVSQFIIQVLNLGQGQHIFNYADKPDLTMEELVSLTCKILERKLPPKIPYCVGLSCGYALDLIASLTGKQFPISAVRVRKFCADTQVGTKQLEELELQPIYALKDGLLNTISYEFLGNRDKQA